MPIVKIRKIITNKNGQKITIISTNMFLEIINVLYDNIYCPVKNYLNKEIDNNEDILRILNLIDDINIHNDLLFCLENKDNKNEMSNIELIIQKYNKNINSNIDTICYYLIDYLNAKNNINTSDSNEIYYMNL